MSVTLSQAALLTEANTRLPKIWCDVDGVLADFHGTFREIYNLNSDNQVNVFLEKPNAWDVVAKKTPNIFALCTPLPDAKRLMTALVNLRDHGHIRLGILTALPWPWLKGDHIQTGKNASRDKKEWIVKNFNGLTTADVVTCARSEKPDYGIADNVMTGLKSVLIDDYKKNVVEWIAQTRGYAIQHKTAESTLSQLTVHLKGLAI